MLTLVALPKPWFRCHAVNGSRQAPRMAGISQAMPVRFLQGRREAAGAWRRQGLVSRAQAGSPTPELTDGPAFAERCVLGRRFSGVVAGWRTRLPPRLATGRQWRAARRADRFACRRPSVALEPRSP